MKPVNERILSEIKKIQLVDTHEHIMPESERNRYALDFSYLFGHSIPVIWCRQVCRRD